MRSALLSRYSLAWLRGEPFPPPPTQLWLALHSLAEDEHGTDEATGELYPDAGRLLLPADCWSPVKGPTCAFTGRYAAHLVNERELTLPVSRNSAPMEIRGLGFWDSARGGRLILRGQLRNAEPGPVVIEPDTFVFFKPGQVVVGLS